MLRGGGVYKFEASGYLEFRVLSVTCSGRKVKKEMPLVLEAAWVSKTGGKGLGVEGLGFRRVVGRILTKPIFRIPPGLLKGLEHAWSSRSANKFLAPRIEGFEIVLVPSLLTLWQRLFGVGICLSSRVRDQRMFRGSGNGRPTCRLA